MKGCVNNDALCDELAKLVGDDQLTSFQLYDILRSNYSFESLKTAITVMIAKRAQLDEDPRILADEGALIKEET